MNDSDNIYDNSNPTEEKPEDALKPEDFEAFEEKEEANEEPDDFEIEYLEEKKVGGGDSEQKPGKKKLTKKQKTIITVSSILAVILVIVGSDAIFIGNKLGLINNDNQNTVDVPFDDEIYDESDFSSIDADIHASNFKEGIKQWATNGGDVMSSKNVLNVLIIGYDSRKNTFSGNTDALMLISLNKKTKTITLSSFLRDSYVYYETENGASGYNKINALLSIGGPECLLGAIENHFKIQIDSYVAVNFDSFEALIDKMGGINVTVQKYESNYYNSYFDKTIPYGENVLLDGYQTLGFCRIRKCDADGDVSRTRRQQAVIQAIIDKVSTASLSDVNKYMDAVLPYVSTNISNQDILSLGTKAMIGKWYSYPIQKMQMPTEEARYGYSGSTWIWAVDYPLATQALQSAVYGSSNIVLNEGRTTIIDILRGSGSGTGSASAHAVPSTTSKNNQQTTAANVNNNETDTTVPSETENSTDMSSQPETQGNTDGNSTTAPPTTQSGIAETQPETKSNQTQPDANG